MKRKERETDREIQSLYLPDCITDGQTDGQTDKASKNVRIYLEFYLFFPRVSFCALESPTLAAEPCREWMMVMARTPF